MLIWRMCGSESEGVAGLQDGFFLVIGETEGEGRFDGACLNLENGYWPC